MESQDQIHTEQPQISEGTSRIKATAATNDVESLLSSKLEEQITLLRKLSEPKRKDRWEKFATIIPLLSTIILALVGTGATLLYNYRESERNRLYNQRESERNQQTKRQEVLVSETQAVKDLIPQLTGQNRESRRTALLTLCSLNNIDLATRLAPQYAVDGGIEALEDLNKRITEESDKQKVKEALAIAYKKSGDNYYDQNNYYDAGKNYSKSIEFNSSFADGYYARFFVYAFTKKYEDAEKDIESYYQISKDIVIKYYLFGVLETHKGNYDKSVEYLDEAIKQEFWWPELFYRKALAQHKNGKHKLALDNYSKAIDDSMNYPNANYYEDRARCKEDMGDPQGANEDRLTAQRIRGNDGTQAWQNPAPSPSPQ